MSGELPVDGGGMLLVEHCKHLAERLALSPEQTEILVSELRNALIPLTLSQRWDSGKGPRGALRILELASALARRFE